MPRPPVIPALLLTLASCAAVWLGGCQQVGFAPNEVNQEDLREEAGPKEAVHVVVQHVLVAHADAGVAGVTRSVDEAGALAEVVLAKARAGEDFEELVYLYGDDRESNGIYAIANFGAATSGEEIGRVTLVKDFGDLAFELEVGEIGLVKYDEARSPHGFHVVKRLR